MVTKKKTTKKSVKRVTRPGPTGRRIAALETQVTTLKTLLEQVLENTTQFTTRVTRRIDELVDATWQVEANVATIASNVTSIKADNERAKSRPRKSPLRPARHDEPGQDEADEP